MVYRGFPDTPPYQNLTTFTFPAGCQEAQAEVFDYTDKQPLAHWTEFDTRQDVQTQPSPTEGYVLSSQELKDVSEIDSTEFDQYLTTGETLCNSAKVESNC
jgi:hypothetical protein